MQSKYLNYFYFKLKKGENMKKRKFALFLNIASICLAICAIAIGVYSIKTASLKVGGSLGFVAHNAKVNIKAYMYGFSTAESGENPVTETNKVQLTADGGLNIDGNNGEVNIQSTKGTGTTKRYFSDASGDLEPITIVLTITNNSNFEVLLEDLTVDSSDYFIICDTPLKVLYTSSTPAKQTTTLTYEIRPAFKDDGKYKELTNASVSISMSFTKTNVDRASTGFTLNETTKTVTGLPTLEQNGGSDILIIPSVFSDKSGVTFTTLGDSSSAECITNAKLYKKIVILDGYTALNGKIFYQCSNLNYLDVPDTVTNVSSQEGFHESGLIYIPKAILNFIKNSVYFNKCTKLKYANVPETVKSLSSPTFSGCSNLQLIKLPKSLTRINFTGVFDGCSSLKRLEFGDTSKTWSVGMDPNTVEMSVANPIQNAIYAKAHPWDPWTKNS